MWSYNIRLRFLFLSLSFSLSYAEYYKLFTSDGQSEREGKGRDTYG